MQSKRISITFGQNVDPVGLSIKRLELSEGAISGVYIKGIQPNSPASRDGRLKVFDELVEVNDRPVRQYPEDQLKSLFTQRGHALKLTVYRNSSAAILHGIGYPIPNDNSGEDPPSTFHSPSNSDPTVEYVELHSDMRDFGFFVAPGCGEYPVINHISPGSVSQLDSRLRMGDELMLVNEHHVRNVASQRVMELLQSYSNLVLKVRHISDPLEKTPTEFRPDISSRPGQSVMVCVTLRRDAKGSLGIVIQGVTSDSADDVSPEDGIYIAKVVPEGPAGLTGLVREGDRIVRVNGTNLKGLRPERALGLVKKSGNPVALVLERRNGAPDLGFEPDSNHGQEGSFNVPSVSDTCEQFPREESVKSSSIHSGVSSIHGFYPSRLSEACLEFSHDPQGTMYMGVVPKEEKIRLVDLWQPRVGSEKIVKIAQLSKYCPGGEIGLEIQPEPVYSQNNELSGMRTIISGISTGPAEDDGILLEGDQLLEINGVRVTDVHYDDVVALLKATPQLVRLVVARPHTRGNIPSHYLMNGSSVSSSDGESPAGTLDLTRKKLFRTSKVRNQENSSGSMTYPRNVQGIMQTDLDEAGEEGVLLLREIQEQKLREQMEKLEQMECEKEKLERELFSKKELNNEDKSQLKASMQQVKLKYEKESTLPRPSRYSKIFPYRQATPHSFENSPHSCITSGIATTPRAPKNSGKQGSVKETAVSLSNSSSPQPLIKRNSLKPDKSKVAELDLTPNETDLLNLVCVPFQRDSGKCNNPRALIPFPIPTHSATTSEDESIHSPTKLSFPEQPMLAPIEQEPEQMPHSPCNMEPHEVTVTKGDTLGIGIERERDIERKGKFKIIIIAIVAGSPAAKDGLLRIGDELLSINTYSLVGKSKEEVALQITNLPRGPVVLTVLHQQQDTLTKHDKSPPAKQVSKVANQVFSSPKRTYTPVTSEKSYLYKKPMEKAFSLSTISDGSRIDFLGSRITHSSSNSNNSINDNIEPYPFKMSLFPPIPQDVGVQHKAWDDFNMEQETLDTEEGHRHRRSKSLDLEPKDNSSSNSLDDIPTSLLDQDISVFPQPGEEPTQSKRSVPIPRNQESPHVSKEGSAHSKYTHSPPSSNPQQNSSVSSEKRHSVPRGVVREVHLSRKSNANLGISIVEKFIPGVRIQFKGIFIKSVTDPILLSGQLEQDDQILEVNGIDMNGFVHDQAVNLIKKASEPVILKVLHSPEFVKRISLDRIANEHAELGGEIIHSYFVTGKKGSGIVVELAKHINERVGRSYFKISEVLRRSSAEESKNILKDDVIINVNGMNAVGIPHHQLVKLLNTPHCEVSIILCRTTAITTTTTINSSANTSPHEINNNGRHYNSRFRRYLKSCLIDKLHEVEICVESQEGPNQKQIIVISSVQSKHPSFLEEIHPGDELVAINKRNLSGCKVESVQRWLFELCGTPQYEISFYSSAPHSTSTSTGSAHSYEQEPTRVPAYSKQLSAQFTYVFLKEARQDVGLVLVDGEVDGVYIEEVDPNGLAAADPRIRPGCRVVAINERNLMNDEATFVDMVLNGVVGQVSLTLESSFIHKVSRKQMEAHGYFRYSSESSQDLSHSPQPPRSMAPPPQIHSEYSHKRGIRSVKLFKEGDKGFGLTLRGGANTSHGDLPIFVGKVFPHQAAYRSGQVQERDVIVAINDIPTLGMTCAEAVAVLKSHKIVTLILSDEKDPIADLVLPHQRNNALLNDLTSSRESLRSREGFVPPTQNSNPERKYGYHPYPVTPPMHYTTNVLIPAYPPNLYPDWSTQYMPAHVMPPHEKLMSASEPPPYDMVSQNYIMKPDPNLIWVHLKSTQRGFGFSISGGVDNMSGPQPILIKSMTEDGAAKLDGNFAVGDEICAVNGYSLINVTHHQAVTILKQCQEKLKPDQEVQLLIRKRQI